MTMFTHDWFDREIAALIVQLHQVEGAINVLRQMKQALDSPAEPEISMDDLQAMLPDGMVLEGIEQSED